MYTGNSPRTLALLGAAAIFLATFRPTLASPDVQGEVTGYTSPSGVGERCVAVQRFPGSNYPDDDRPRQAALCAIDFHGDRHALCPKVFSANPGTLLAFIFSQQDRIGNIDYVDTWHWVADGKLRTRAAEGRTPPADIAAAEPVRLKRTELGDNDAGVRLSYANYTKRTDMLEKLRHYRAGTYQRLMRLQQDFAAHILRSSCEAGRVRFDAEPEEFLLNGRLEPGRVSC